MIDKNLLESVKDILEETRKDSPEVIIEELCKEVQRLMRLLESVSSKPKNTKSGGRSKTNVKPSKAK